MKITFAIFGLCIFALCACASAQTRYTTILEVTPASTAFPCISVAATDKTYALCGQNNAITVDFGDGKGYVNLQGPKGDSGTPGSAATVTVGTTTVGPVAAVTNSGTSSAAVLNFVLPQLVLPPSFTCDFVLAAGGKATLSNCK